MQPGGTLFFAGLEANIAFQCADGPLIRWAYRDPTLRSYYLTSFTREKARSGPLYFFVGSGDTLRELERGPDLLPRVALAMIISDKPEGARDALELHAERDAPDRSADYRMAWVSWASGDTLAALESLRRAGIEPNSRKATERPRALAAVSAGDTLGAQWIMQSAVRAAPLDAAAHGLLADLLLIRRHDDPEGAVEAFAARLLAPDDPTVWKRWGMVQLDRGRYLDAPRSLERCQALGDPQAVRDSEVQGWIDGLRGRMQGARLAVGDSGT
jgi:Flp pilus assembly protein TadD